MRNANVHIQSEKITGRSGESLREYLGTDPFSVNYTVRDGTQPDTRTYHRTHHCDGGLSIRRGEGRDGTGGVAALIQPDYSRQAPGKAMYYKL